MNRNKIYDCTKDFEARNQFLGEMLLHRRIGLQQSPLEEALLAKDARLILVDPALSEELIEKHQSRLKELEILRSVDALVFEGGKWWLQCFHRQAFRELVVSANPDVDTHLKVYLAGTNPLLPVCLEAFSRLGFTEFVWVTEHPEIINPIVERLKKLLIGLSIVSMDSAELTMQANDGCITVNGVMGSDPDPVIGDLAYLNFFKPPGIIFDLGESQNVEWAVMGGPAEKAPVLRWKDVREAFDSAVIKYLVNNPLSLK